MATKPETLIADRGGATPGYANDPAKLLLTNKWVDQARPIIKAMLVLDDAGDAPLVQALCATHRSIHHRGPETWQERDYRGARKEIAKAGKALFNMIEDIRDNFIADECAGIGDNDDETQAADEFNDWLTDNTISVNAAIDMVADEQIPR